MIHSQKSKKKGRGSIHGNRTGQNYRTDPCGCRSESGGTGCRCGRRSKKTLADAAAEAEQKANVLLADSEKVGADIKARAASTAEFTRRRTVLAAKQNAIRDVIAAAQKELHDLPDDEYFSVLLKLAQKNALPGDAEMQLNEKDLARMPQDFRRS